MEGARLGPYQLLAELGSGGMGKVYRAEVAGPVPGLDPGCAVALKVIHAHLLETPGFFKRFLREADLGRTIEHENVVRTYDCDALLHDGTQQNFLVMEYVEGQTLRDLLQELERVPEELCRHIGREVAKGLAAIHEAGVVHRDLKPENVLITSDHVVKIMDLGVARLQAEAVRLSQTGAFVGSLEYAAPEQFRSSDGEPDGRADLHALGVLLYELATGVHPYRDEDASRVIGHILNDEPRKAGELNPQLSPFFEEVVQTLIAKDREERFPAASDLAFVLDEGEESDWWKARAKALRVETKRPLRRIRIPRETALYGRDDDLAWMRKAYDTAKEGEGQVLLIEGEAGIGKTRLVDEFVGQLLQDGEDINFLFGSYPPGGAATAAGAFSEAYREQFGAEGLEDTLEGYLTVTPLLVPAFAALLKGDATPKDAEPLTKDSLQTVFVHATRGLAAERTTIVLIDDLHFAPEDGRALFTSLTLALAEHRILLIGTMRPGVPDEWTAGITRLDHTEQRSLSRLGLKDFSALLKDAFRSERLAHELGMKIAEKSDGNPFFAFEIIRGLREGQFISQQPDGTWVTTRVIEDIQVPSSVLDLVNARISDLSEEERDLLDVAACCGFEFEPGLVAEALGTARIPSLKRLGQIERRHRLVRTSGRTCVFDHHQVQEALYGSLMPELREAYHVTIGNTLERRMGADADAPEGLDGGRCAELCHHFFLGGVGRRAADYIAPAMRHLARGYLNEQVVQLAESAFAVPGLLVGDKRADALLSQSAGLYVLGRPSDALQAIKVAEALNDETSPNTQMQVMQSATNVLLALGEFSEGKARAEQELVLARQHGNTDAEAAATINLGVATAQLGDFESAKEHYEEGLRLAVECGNKAWEANATGNLAGACRVLGSCENAREMFERQLVLAREAGYWQGESGALRNLVDLLTDQGAHEEASECIRRLLSIAQETGDREREAAARLHEARLQTQEGRFSRAWRAAESALALAREIQSVLPEHQALATLADLASKMGRPDEARERWMGIRDTARALGAIQRESTANGALATLAQIQGCYEEALELCEEAIHQSRRIGHARNATLLEAKRAAIWLDLGRYEAAEEALASLRRSAVEQEYLEAEAVAVSNMAVLHEALGRQDKAEAEKRHFLSLAERFGRRDWMVLANLQLARNALLAGHGEKVLTHLSAAKSLGAGVRTPELELYAATLQARSQEAGAEDLLATLRRVEQRVPLEMQMEALLALDMLTGDPAYLEHAKALVDRLVSHAPEQDRRAMVERVPTLREIMEAWAEHGGEAAKEAVE